MTQQERLIYLVKGLVEEYTEKYKDEAYRTKSVCENPYNTRYLLVL